MVPVGIQAILAQLNRAGYAAYYVGGCVRDMLLGRPVNDWDITTQATPGQVMALFDRVIPTGIAHGTVTVLYAGEKAEITTFRADGDYCDSRHPKQVHFVDSLQADLQRRDFTVNAMAMDLQGEIYDFSGGMEDLRLRQLRCVGNPIERFSEDALRMLRAVRFSAQLGFSIAENALEGAKQCSRLCRQLSVERVRDEMEKTLLSPNPQKLAQMAGLGLLERFGIGQAEDCSLLAAVAPRRVVRWSAAMVCYPQLQPNVLRLDRQTQKTAQRAAQRYSVPFDRAACKTVIAEDGPAVGECYAELSGGGAVYDEILASGECVSLRQLAVSGNDLYGCPPRQIGAVLHRLLQLVLEDPESNRRDVLLEQYENMKK